MVDKGAYKAGEIKVNEETNIIFQIFSKQGRSVLTMTPNDSEMESLLG